MHPFQIRGCRIGISTHVGHVDSGALVFVVAQAGVLGAAREYPSHTLLVLACDLPLVSLDVLRHLASFEADLVVPRHRSSQDPPLADAESGAQTLVEPLCALYSPAAVAALERRAQAGRYDLHGLTGAPDLEVVFVDGTEFSAFGEPAVLFSNLNRPQDVEKLAALRHKV